MKKLIVLLFFISISFVSMAQNMDSLYQAPHRAYCELLGASKFMSLKLNVTIDFGQDEQGYYSKLVDNDGKPISFNSMVDAMNYMGKIGWKFEQAYVVSCGSQLVYHWLLSKNVTIDSQIKDGFKIRNDFKHKNKTIKDDVY